MIQVWASKSSEKENNHYKKIAVDWENFTWTRVKSPPAQLAISPEVPTNNRVNH
jgi:hypothetical protein